MRETEGGDAVDVRRGGDVRAPDTGRCLLANKHLVSRAGRA
jgi:hypothetical protein